MYEKIEKYLLTEIERLKLPGLSIAITRDQDVIWSKGYGYSNVEEQIKATENTVYHIASMTKPVISTGLLQWLEKGKFRLDDPVNDYLEKIKIQTIFDEQPTIRNLLTHTSGLPTHIPPIYYNTCEAISLEELIRRYAKVTQRPNCEWVYSNNAFAIIGYLVGQFAGQQYTQYMKENVLEPLEMKTSDFVRTPEIEMSLAQRYERIKPSDPLDTIKPYFLGCLPEQPCGCLYTTVIDYAHFLIAHMNRGVYKRKRILNEETLEEMHKLQWAPGISKNGFGLSWARGSHYGHLSLSHGGGMPGWSTFGIMYPVLKLGIIIFSNLSGGPNWRDLFAGAVLRILLDEYKPFDPKTIWVEKVPNQWQNLTGTYIKLSSYQSGVKSYIKIKDGYLILEMGGQKIYLEKIDEKQYMLHGGDSDGRELTFEYDEQGRAKQFDLGTAIYTHYVEEKVTIDENADLIGSWHGEYLHPYGLFTLDMEIKSAKRASVTDMEGRNIPVTNFEAVNGRVTGKLKLTSPREFKGWESWVGYNFQLNLLAVDKQLNGHLITLAPAQWEGTLIPLSLSRS